MIIRPAIIFFYNCRCHQTFLFDRRTVHVFFQLIGFQKYGTTWQHSQVLIGRVAACVLAAYEHGVRFITRWLADICIRRYAGQRKHISRSENRAGPAVVDGCNSHFSIARALARNKRSSRLKISQSKRFVSPTGLRLYESEILVANCSP